MCLAQHWTYETTWQLCRQAVDDEHEDVRSTTLELLTKHWLDQNTSQLLRKFIHSIGIAASRHGKEHSRFGEIVFWLLPDFDSEEWRDPRQPIPAEYIQKAAKIAGIPQDQIDETVRSLSAHMGWDITKGSLAGKL